MKASKAWEHRPITALTTASFLMYAATLVFLLLGIATWEPGRNPRWLIGLMAALASVVLLWISFRGRRFTTFEASFLLAVQLGCIGALSWSTNQDLGAFANGMALPIFGVYAVWFLQWPSGRIVVYVGVIWWLTAVAQRGSIGLAGFAVAQALQTIIATEVFARIKQRMDALASTDPLTGALNVRGVTEALARELARARRRKSAVSVIAIDLDGLRELNNSRGHRAGDGLLKAVTGHWRGEVRNIDMIGRTGGDEFVIVLPDTTEAEAKAVATRLSVTSPGDWSAGVAQAEPDDTVETLLERADKLMYEHKASRQSISK
jgi:diguanylate cyclase (GGDEF)-like protein